MFRRPWSALPSDTEFPADLAELGYFINSDDEIRKIDDSDYYFKYHIDKNDRVNGRQRLAFDNEVRKIVHQRIEEEGLCKQNLPLGASLAEPHVPVFVTSDLASQSRIVVILGDPYNHLGMLARRVAGGPGGINKGSTVSLIMELKQHDSVGIVLANMGELYWWPEGKKTITVQDATDLKMPSMAHRGRKYYASVNDVPYNEDLSSHLRSVLEDIVKPAVKEGTMVDIIAIGTSCEVLLSLLDDETEWDRWSDALNAMVLFGPQFPVEHVKNDKLKKFMKERIKAYICSWCPQDNAVAGVDDNDTESRNPLGVQCFSGGDSHFIELLAVNCVESAVQYLQDVRSDPNFKNPPVTVTDEDVLVSVGEEDGWSGLSEEDRPFIDKLDSAELEEQIKQSRRWQKYLETGVAVDTDEDADSKSEPSDKVDQQ